jgi:large subunit ribosomal protein L18
MNSRKLLNHIRIQRVRRVRAKIAGAPDCPRLAVFRSNRALSAQLIDDSTGRTLVAVAARELGKAKQTKSEQAARLGELLAEKAKKAGITQAVFDRRSYAYHGRVKAFAEGARKGGLKF